MNPRSVVGQCFSGFWSLVMGDSFPGAEAEAGATPASTVGAGVIFKVLSSTESDSCCCPLRSPILTVGGSWSWS